MVRNQSTEVYSVSAVESSNGNLAIFTTSDSEVVYSILRRGAWSPARRLALNASVTVDVGLEAIRRLEFAFRE